MKKFDDRQPNIKDFQQPDPNLSDEFIVKFQDGSQRILPENSLDEFVIDNKTKYNFIYVEEDVQQTAEQIDKLIESGSQDDLQLAFDKLDKALKSKPTDGLLQDKFDRIKQLLEKLEIGQQPILKLLLGLITLPVKIIGENKKLIVTDFEIFEDVILYYTNDGYAYPEDKLENLNSLNEEFNMNSLRLEIVKKISKNNNPEFILFFSDKINKSLEGLDLINGWLVDENGKTIIFENNLPNLIGGTSGQTSVPFFTRFCKWIGLTSC